MKELCPCGSESKYEKCCGRLISGKETAQTAVELMKSRYSAYVKCEIDYIASTQITTDEDNVNRDDIEKWSKGSEWLGLEIVGSRKGGPEDEIGEVEFIASYRPKDQDKDESSEDVKHRELSTFKKIQGEWKLIEGKIIGARTVIRSSPKIGRNDPCLCGSGKKFKKCCMDNTNQLTTVTAN